MKKERFFRIVKKIVTPSLIKGIILLLPITLLIIFKAKGGDLKLEDFFAIDTFAAIVLAFLCQGLADIIVKSIEKKNEDCIKLTDNYKALVKKYSREQLLTYQGEKFPTVCLLLRKANDPSFHLMFDDSKFNKKYQLPSQVARQSDFLMKAHAYSKVYNQLNIRLDNLVCEGENVTLCYSQTYYYDSLITNRAMDYLWESGKSVREVYEPGPFLNPLDESRLSNHLGFNGFVETSDGKIIIVRRGKKLSIGKDTWASSIGASLKAVYALNDERKLDAVGLSNAIKKEIWDELYIDIAPDVDMTQSIFAFYRDIVEGGKPQFLFYYKLENCTFEAFENHFKGCYQERNNVVDGTSFMGLTIEQCRECRLTANGFSYQGQFYKMTASAAASLAMLLQHLQN